MVPAKQGWTCTLDYTTVWQQKAYAYERMAFLGQRLWQNKTAGTGESILMLQYPLPSAARVIPQGAAKACGSCCLHKLSSDMYTEGEPVQSANLCFLCNLLHMHICAVASSESLARVLSLVTFDSRLLTVSKIYNNNNWRAFLLMMS